MSLRSALTHLAALSVSGVVHNYDVDAVPDDLSRAQLPALLVLPLEVETDRLYRERGQGFEAIAFSSGPRTVTYTVTHLLLIAAVDSRRGFRSHLPDLADRIDAYFAALSADITLGGTLLQPAQVQVEPRIFQYGHASYAACAFRHRWVIQI